jgi:hypothetical protein
MSALLWPQASDIGCQARLRPWPFLAYRNNQHVILGPLFSIGQMAWLAASVAFCPTMIQLIPTQGTGHRCAHLCNRNR